MSVRLRFAEITSVTLGEIGKSCSIVRHMFTTADYAQPTPFSFPPGTPGDLLITIGHFMYSDEACTVGVGLPSGWNYMVPGSLVWWRWADGTALDRVGGFTTGTVMQLAVRNAAPAGTASGRGGSPLFTISDGAMGNEGPNWHVDMSEYTIRNRVPEASADLLVGALSIIYALGSCSPTYGLTGLHTGWPQPDASEYVASGPGDINPFFGVLHNEPWYATAGWPRASMMCTRLLDTTMWPGPEFTGIGNTSFFEQAGISIGWIAVQPWWNADYATVLLDGVEVDVQMAVDSSPAVGDILWIAQEGRRMYGIGHTPAPPPE